MVRPGSGWWAERFGVEPDLAEEPGVRRGRGNASKSRRAVRGAADDNTIVGGNVNLPRITRAALVDGSRARSFSSGIPAQETSCCARILLRPWANWVLRAHSADMTHYFLRQGVAGRPARRRHSYRRNRDAFLDDPASHLDEFAENAEHSPAVGATGLAQKRPRSRRSACGGTSSCRDEPHLAANSDSST